MSTEPRGSTVSGVPYIPSLDGFRTISFLIVFLSHAGLDWVIPGGFGVTVFFFLSGFLIATLMRLEFEQSKTINFRYFYLRRALRILPPFYLVLGCAITLSFLGVLPGALALRPVLAQVLHIANYWDIWHGTQGQAPGTGVYWSLAVEEHFYVLFPCLYLVLQRFLPTQTRRVGVLFALCALVLAWRCYLVYVAGVAIERTYEASDTRIDSLIFGCAMATWNNPVLDLHLKPLPALWKSWLLPAGIAGLIASFLYREPRFRETFRYTLQGLSLFPVFVVAVREPKLWPFSFLNWRWVKFAGTLSYSLYLVHQVILFALMRPIGHPFWRGVLGLALSFVIALAIHRFVEIPCARLRRRFTSRGARGFRVPEPFRDARAVGETSRP